MNIYEFQSTFPRGERRDGISALMRLQEISIHVPAWGTTEHLSIIHLIFIFQSTFPRGERHTTYLKKTLAKAISIHVPAWGTTLC